MRGEGGRQSLLAGEAPPRDPDHLSDHSASECSLACLHLPPFVNRVDQQIDRHGEPRHGVEGECPPQRRLAACSEHEHHIEVAAHAPVAARVGAEVADPHDARGSEGAAALWDAGIGSRRRPPPAARDRGARLPSEELVLGAPDARQLAAHQA